MKNGLYQLTLATMVIASVGMASLTFGDEASTRFIQNAHYDTHRGELIIENQDNAVIEPHAVSHNARRRELTLYIPHTGLQPTPKTLEVKNDAIVKRIKMEQRALNGEPAVRVEIQLYTNSPYLPFKLLPEAPGLKIGFKEASLTPNAAQTTPPETVVLETPQTHLKPLTLSKPAETTAAQTHTPNTVSSVIGQVPTNTYSVIQDIFFENDSLHVISQQKPIQVERSFVLNQPNRYVVDISPAVLQSKSLLRAVPHTNPNILNFRAGQLDDNTVRIVVQYKNQALPTSLSQDSTQSLKINF